jgi:uncharacterized phage infection (PIP) family protein YhgE
MALGDYFKGPEHKANAARLEAELLAHRQQSQANIQALQAELLAHRQQSQANSQALQAKYDDLETKTQQLRLLDLLEVHKQIRAEEARLAEVQAQVDTTQSDLEAARGQLQAVQQQILVAEDTVLLESFALYEPKYQFTNSVDYKARLDEIREDQKRTARGLSAEVDAWDNYAVELTKAQWKKLRKDALKLALRSFNSESEYCVDNVKFSNLEKMEERIRRSFESCNKLLNAIDAFWNDIVLECKLQELYLAHEYQVKRQEEKDAARQAREDQREQEKLEREIREARAKIEKERRHFAIALQKLQLRLGAANDQQERDDLQTRIDELSSQNRKLDEEERLLDYREQNARAGYVYVISNIGAFGEGIYKIGMTRRLEPMDRVDELGDASVPFRFDVHALIFSDNAPALEAKLHSHCAAGRLNKVNGRKEFFRADLKEIEAVIRANYDAVVEMAHAAPAEQYRESLRLAMPVESIQASERIALGESAKCIVTSA